MTTIAELETGLRREFTKLRVGETTVLGLSVEPFDLGEDELLKVTLSLTPPRTRKGWPHEDTSELRRRIWAATDRLFGDDYPPMLYVPMTTDPAGVDPRDVAVDAYSSTPPLD